MLLQEGLLLLNTILKYARPGKDGKNAESVKTLTTNMFSADVKTATIMLTVSVGRDALTEDTHITIMI